MPPEVVTFTTTASRLTAVPMPSATRFASGIGKDVGKAFTSVIRSSGIQRFRVDQVDRALAGEHAQHLPRGGDARARARRDGAARKVRRKDDVVEVEELVPRRDLVMLVDVEHR